MIEGLGCRSNRALQDSPKYLYYTYETIWSLIFCMINNNIAEIELLIDSQFSNQARIGELASLLNIVVGRNVLDYAHP
jgi:hypothetical protein